MSDNRKIIEEFLSRAAERVHNEPGRIPMDAITANAAIAWLRGLLDRKEFHS